ncbi:MAG: hypothetical protein WCJ02_02190 [bacterium]
MLHPFLGFVDTGGIDSGRFDYYYKHADKCFSLVPSPEEADLLVCPIDYTYEQCKNIAPFYNDLAGKLNKPFLLFFINDSFCPIFYENAIILRTSLNKKKQRPNEFSIPGWSKDHLIDDLNKGINFVRPKRTIPSIGYCGYGKNTIQSMKDALIRIQGRLIGAEDIFTPHAFRWTFLSSLQRTSGIDCHFIIRKHFWGAGGNMNVTRSEFIENLKNNDYAFATRGRGNYSYRLYEIISCGRIPLFVNTDAVLPYDWLIDYRKLFVWVDPDQHNTVGVILKTFHANCTDEMFILRQREMRNLYENWLSPYGFFKNLWRLLAFKHPQA